MRMWGVMQLSVYCRCSGLMACHCQRGPYLLEHIMCGAADGDFIDPEGSRIGQGVDAAWQGGLEGRLREHQVVMRVPYGRQQHNARSAAVLVCEVPQLGKHLLPEGESEPTTIDMAMFLHAPDQAEQHDAAHLHGATPAWP